MARQIRGRAAGYDLKHDLKAIVDSNNPVCFDVGANQGQTIQLLQQCFASPVIHAFEPSSTTYSSLVSQSFGPQVHLHQMALGEHSGTAEFRNYKHSDLSSFLPVNPDAENIFAEVELISLESVSVNTLDQFCAGQNIEQIDLLKIDTQGFELPVLRGGIELLRNKQIKTVLLELNFSMLYEKQSDPLDILHLLRDCGLRLVDYYEKERLRGKELSWVTALFTRYP